MERSRTEPQAALSAWYRPGADDSIYKEALDTCRSSKYRLAKYLPPDDVLLLRDKGGNLGGQGFDAIAVDQFIQERYREATKRSEQPKTKLLSDATNSFAKVAVQLSQLLEPMLPQSPEYTIPFGCLMIIFKILVAKQDKGEKVIAIFDNLLQKLTSLDLYRVAFPTHRIKVQLAKTIIDVLTLVVCVTEYCAIGRISKLVDAISLKSRYDFEEGLQTVEKSCNSLKQFVEEAITAVTIDSYETLKDQSRKIDYITDKSDYMATNIAALSQAVDILQIKQTKLQFAQTRNWSDILINDLLPDTNTEWEELTMWQSREFRLSPKDHWEVNGLLDYFQEWNRLESASILAIFGRTESRDTWVTEFSLDMIQAFQVQDSLVTYALCDRPEEQVFTPTVVIKKLICQLLEKCPGLILEAPEILNSRVFRRCTDFDQACLLFSSIVARLTTPLAIIVDRIDCCEADVIDSKNPQNIVGFFSKLLKNSSKGVKVIVTSADEPPDIEELPAEFAVSICMISTRTRPLRKEAYHQRTRRRGKINVYVPEIHLSSLVGSFEELYKLRIHMNKRKYYLDWFEKLEPRTARERMILRHFGLPNCKGLGTLITSFKDGVRTSCVVLF